MELLVILIALIVFAFIVYSTYASRKSKYAQKKRALELKEAHMIKSMDRVRTEIELIEKEIQISEYSLEKLTELSV